MSFGRGIGWGSFCCEVDAGADGVEAWGKAHRRWLDGVTLERPEQEAVFLDYRHEVDHAVERVARLERALMRRWSE